MQYIHRRPVLLILTIYSSFRLRDAVLAYEWLDRLSVCTGLPSSNLGCGQRVNCDVMSNVGIFLEFLRGSPVSPISSYQHSPLFSPPLPCHNISYSNPFISCNPSNSFTVRKNSLVCRTIGVTIIPVNDSLA